MQSNEVDADNRFLVNNIYLQDLQHLLLTMNNAFTENAYLQHTLYE